MTIENLVVETKTKTQLKWLQNWSTIRLQKSPGENENTTSGIRQNNIYNIDQDKEALQPGLEKNIDSTKSFGQVSNFYLEA